MEFTISNYDSKVVFEDIPFQKNELMIMSVYEGNQTIQVDMSLPDVRNLSSFLSEYLKQLEE